MPKKRRPRLPCNPCRLPQRQGLTGTEAAADIVALFYDPDKFAVAFPPEWHRNLLAGGRAHRRRPGGLCLGEVMTVPVPFHDSAYRTFKDVCVRHVGPNLRGEFPGLPSYGRFAEQVPAAFAGPTAFLQTRVVGGGDGLAFAGSTALRACHNARINGHRVMAGRPPGVRRPRAGSTTSSCTWRSTAAAG